MTDPYNDPWVEEFIQQFGQTKSEDPPKFLNEKSLHLPDKLYRYREITQQNCDTLVGEWSDAIGKSWHVVWLSHPSKYDDPDSQMSFSEDALQKRIFVNECRLYLESVLGIDITQKKLDALPEEDNGFFLQGLTAEVLKTAREHGEGDPQQILDLIKKESKTNEKMDAYKKSVQDRMYHRLAICCFTDDKHSDSLWAKFGNKNTGMCLEYDMRRCANFQIQKSEMYPVYYSDIPIDLSDLLSSDFKRTYWNPRILRAILTKKTEFHAEREWRFVLSYFASEKGLTFPFLKPSTIYLGSDVSCENQQKVHTIAKSLGIRIIQLRKGDKPNTYSEVICD
jgi:hypothetical protein